MTVFAIGEMFWGKAQLYPWWPSVIVTDESGIWQRRSKKFGVQYHVQFIGNEYDPSWISEEFLVEFHGKDRFEQYVIDQLNSSLPAQVKLKFDMRMSQSIKESWTHSCDSAELLYSMDNNSRLEQLPKSKELQIVNKSNRKRSMTKKEIVEADIKSENAAKKTRIRKSTTNISDNDVKMNPEIEIKEIKKEPKKNRKKAKQRSSNVSDQEEESFLKSFKSDDLSSSNDLDVSNNVLDHCFRAYLSQEKMNLQEDNDISVDQSNLEKTLKDRWSALDIETKLLYAHDEVNIIGISQSKVSGRKIRVPSRLRTNDNVSKFKRSNKAKVTPEYSSKKSVTKTSDLTSGLLVKVEDVSFTELKSNSSSPNVMEHYATFHESINESLWKGLSSENCLVNIMKIVIQGSIPEVPKTCCYCFIPLLSSDNIVNCKGQCQATYHLKCATDNRVLRSDGSQICIYCDQQQELCCICKNSKYMNKKFLVKCQKDNCSFYFHLKCSKVLTFKERTENEVVFCPHHSCLTCTREDESHPCGKNGMLLSCIKCQLLYHDNLICIPAGSRIVSKNRLICYRHFDSKLELKDSVELFRCFRCFETNATLKCCECRSVFHPKCLGLATYSDLLTNYICTTCKLNQPVFYGQIMWIFRTKKWIPAEIVDYHQIGDGISKWSLALEDLENDIYYLANRSELIPFISGLSILKDKIDLSDSILKLAQLRNILYWNWRSRLRPVKSEKFPFLDQTHLLKYSLKDFIIPATEVNVYRHISKNVYSKPLKKYIPPIVSHTCCSSSVEEACSTDICSNVANNIECNESNCSNNLCNNRLFAKARPSDPCIIESEISGQGVKLNDSVEENQLLGECTGTVVSVESVLKQMYEREHLSSVSYLFQLTENLFLNCERTGNEWRHVNHSCTPNARISIRYFSGSLRLAISSLRAISNEEITVDYRSSGLVLKYGFICQCKSSECSTIVGPSSIFLNTATLIIPRCCVNNSVKKCKPECVQTSSLPLQSIENVKVTDDSCHDKVTCHKCGNHGEFITCDKVICKKRYHLSCINAASKPKGIWLCPIHFCFYCGQSATNLCDNCPISCCGNHLSMYELHKCTRMTEEWRSYATSENLNESLIDIYKRPLETPILKEENIDKNNEDTMISKEYIKETLNDPKEQSICSNETTKDEDVVIEENGIISDTKEMIPQDKHCNVYKDFNITKEIIKHTSDDREINSNNTDCQGSNPCEIVLEKEEDKILRVKINNERKESAVEDNFEDMDVDNQSKDATAYILEGIDDDRKETVDEDYLEGMDVENERKKGNEDILEGIDDDIKDTVDEENLEGMDVGNKRKEAIEDNLEGMDVDNKKEATEDKLKGMDIDNKRKEATEDNLEGMDDDIKEAADGVKERNENSDEDNFEDMDYDNEKKEATEDNLESINDDIKEAADEDNLGMDVNERNETTKDNLESMNDVNDRDLTPKSCDSANLRYECLPCSIEEEDKVICAPIIDE